MDKFKDLDDAALAALLEEKQAAAATLVASVGDSAPTGEQATEALGLTASIDEIKTEQADRAATAAKNADAFNALKASVEEPDETDEPDEGETTDEPDEEPEPAEEPDAEPDDEADDAGDAVTAAAKPTKVAATLAKRTRRPKAPATEEPKRGFFIAAVPGTGFSAGQEMAGMEDIVKGITEVTRGFAPPQGDGSTVDLRKFGVANIKIDYPADMIVSRQTSDDETFAIMERARDEKRLEGNSLTAAGGWCAPSETIYDLPADESLDGMVSIPEFGVTRGGVRWTPGPQFSDFYANAGFAQSEAQAIAGTTKPCYEVTCPEFSEMRLEAVGLCLKVPILTNSAYPELINRFTSGTLVAHEHWKNARVIGKMVALAGTARVFTGGGSTVQDTMSALELVAEQRRQMYRLSFTRTMEVVVPHWVKGVLRDDLSIRNGVGAEAITDAQIAAHFSVRGVNVQYVYDWQDLDTTAEVYPGTFNMLVYPAGTFIKGTSDVINLSAVYDAASLAVNTYTGLFMEQGLLVASMQYGADLVTIPIESVGRTGRQDFAVANS